NVGANSKRRRLNSGRTPLSVELDQRVFEFLEEERSEGRPVTNTTLQAKAVQIAAGLGLSTFRGGGGKGDTLSEYAVAQTILRNFLPIMLTR
ncbi:MAG: DNA-binding domain-containing protein, partial [Proteobacteria bacterium]|nr:DNA-binding domain-containing protein [Pseudomonadota bacterium]